MSETVALAVRDGASPALAVAAAGFDAGLVDLAGATAAALLDRAHALADGVLLADVTGAYERSLFAQVERRAGGVAAVLGSDAIFAGLLEYGGHTAAHVERPVDAAALRVFAGADAEAVFAAVVHHPGATVAPHLVLRTALAGVAGTAFDGADALLARLARSLA